MKCMVCQEHEQEAGSPLCGPCIRSWQRLDDVTRWADIEWAAKRALRFERKRQKAAR